jgi:hypothetical protein
MSHNNSKYTHHPITGKPYTDHSKFTDSVWNSIKDDYEAGEYTIQEIADNWNIAFKPLSDKIFNSKWLGKKQKKLLEEHLVSHPKECRELSSHRTKAHAALSPAELLVVKKAKAIVDFQCSVLDIGMDALDKLKDGEGLEIRSAFDFEKVAAVMSKTLGLDETNSTEAPTVNVNFSSSKHKPSVVVDVE